MHPDSGRADRAPELPFNAYDGDDPYIFVAYAHKDKALVYPEIGRLHELGYRIWYDEGIPPTSEWLVEVDRHIEGCALFLVFISDNAFASEYVCDEINHAFQCRKPFLRVHLERTELPEGLRMRMQRIQAIHKYSESEEHYRTLVERALGRYDVQGPQPKPDRIVGPTDDMPDPSAVLRAGKSVGPTREVGQEIIGPHGAPMVWAPSGSFTMGSQDYGDERPPHPQTLTGLWIDKLQVTNELFARFLNEYGRLTDDQDNSLINISSEFCGIVAGREFSPKPGREEHPVVGEIWYGAVEFAKRYGLRLPTEAQWEYAARGPEALEYPWGNEWDAMKCCNAANHGVGNPPTMEVGTIPAGKSWCGAMDMVGNVWEWISRGDPQAAGSRELRGGSWCGTQDDCRSAGRLGGEPVLEGIGDGFRVARTP